MKNLIFLMFCVNTASAQTIEANCYQENTCRYSSGGGDFKTIKRNVRVCYNKNVFAFSDGRSVISFPITYYEQQILHGNLYESFDSPGEDGLAGDYMVQIEHSKPADVLISRVSAPYWTYEIKTYKIPHIYVQLTPEYRREDSIKTAKRKADRRKKIVEDSMAKAEDFYVNRFINHYIDSMENVNLKIMRHIDDSLKKEEKKGKIDNWYNAGVPIYQVRSIDYRRTATFDSLYEDSRRRYTEFHRGRTQ